MLDKILDLPIIHSHYRGKVRDVLDLGNNLLVITSDRVSAFDVVFPNEIPGKGKILNQISTFFFNQTNHIIKNHFITNKIEEMPSELLPFKDYLAGRSMLVKKTRVIPYECICRGYISGSAWAEYQKSGTICGQIISDSLKQSQRFNEPIFTPSTKSDTGHDENISYKKMSERMDIEIAEKLKKSTINLYSWIHKFLLDRDIIIADTKLEFGTANGELYLIDELFTPDSSRFWDKAEYEIGISPKSYDKQFIRDFVSESGWNKQAPAPELPNDVIEMTLNKYCTIFEKITGDKIIL